MPRVQSAAAWLTEPFSASPTIEMIDEVAEGLPFNAADELASALAPHDQTFKYRLVPKATYARRKAAHRLSAQESERLVRLARIWKLARDVWKNDDKARRFLTTPHMLLDGRAALDVALASELGGKMVEDLLGRVAYSVAV
jgi:putative toxin-antitoxin system antitoxin component (TIGR02293 family)